MGTIMLSVTVVTVHPIRILLLAKLANSPARSAGVPTMTLSIVGRPRSIVIVNPRPFCTGCVPITTVTVCRFSSYNEFILQISRNLYQKPYLLRLIRSRGLIERYVHSTVHGCGRHVSVTQLRTCRLRRVRVVPAGWRRLYVVCNS